MDEYSINRKFADLHLPQVRVIIAEEIIKVAPFKEDTMQATDLVVLTIRRGQIAVRLRRPGYDKRYPWEFTIRYRAANHSPNTEYRKIVDEGWADLFFYGHLNREEIIHRWFLLDCDVLRRDLRDHTYIRAKAHLMTNHDREQTQLIAFDMRWFSPDLIVKSSHIVPGE